MSSGALGFRSQSDIARLQQRQPRSTGDVVPTYQTAYRDPRKALAVEHDVFAPAVSNDAKLIH